MQRTSWGFIFVFLCLLILSPGHAQEKPRTERELIQAYLSAATDGDRIDILKLLENCATQASRGIFQSALSDGQSSTLRARGARGLGMIRQGRAELEKAFETEDEMVRESVIDALAEIHDPASNPLFETCWRNASPRIRLSALRGLSQSAAPSQKNIFLEALSGQREVLPYAIIGLGRTGRKEDFPLIRKYCADEDLQLLLACIEAAGNLHSPESLDLIETYMRHANPLVSRRAMESLAKFDPASAVDALIRFKASHEGTDGRELMRSLFQKFRAAQTYALLKESAALHRERNERSIVLESLQKDSVVEVLGRENQRYVLRDSRGLDNYWYRVRTRRGKTGYVFGSFLTTVRPFSDL